MVYNGIASKIKAPTASVKAGTYTSSQKVELKSDIEGAEIYYTLNGDVPTEKSTLYAKAVTISKTCTLKAIAVVGGIASDVMSVEYTIKSATGSSGGSSGSSSNDDTSYDDNYSDGSADNSGSDNAGDNTGSGSEEPQGPTEEEIEKSNEICTDLNKSLSDIEAVFTVLELDLDPEFNDDPVNIKVTEKTIEILEYVKKDIGLTLEAAENGTIISKKYVRTTYAEDIAAVKAIIDALTDEEFQIFKNEKMNYLNVSTVYALIEHFDINTEYRQ